MKTVRVDLTIRIVEECTGDSDGCDGGEHRGYEIQVGAGFGGVPDAHQAEAIGHAIAQAGGRAVARIAEEDPEIRRQAERLTNAAFGPDVERTDDAPSAEELERLVGDTVQTVNSAEELAELMRTTTGGVVQVTDPAAIVEALKALAEMVERPADDGQTSGDTPE